MYKNYCIVGTGQRSIGMYAKDLVHQYTDVAKLTGLCDPNPGRLEWAKSELGIEIPCFTDFDKMLDTVPCDSVIVTTIDSVHDEFIIKAMQRGKDVITEKPITINEEKMRRIIAAEKETGRDVKVTFNCRYIPYTVKIKEMLSSGIVGDIHSVEFKWSLDTVHGADYFRRWHRKKENSGGLLVHKSTHHFDMINWWLDMEPQEVSAMGSRHYYKPEQKPGHGERCLTCSITDECEFYLDINSGQLKEAYSNHERHDNYYRDRCIFSEEIDIEDTMSVLVRYPKGVQLTYALTAATSVEGWQIAFNGSKGRLEAFEPGAFITKENQTSYHDRSKTDVRRRLDWRMLETTGNHSELESNQIRFYPIFGGVTTVEIPHAEGGHGGGDSRLKNHLFRPGDPDPLQQSAGVRAGAMSMLIGAAANRSMAEKRFVTIKELLEEG